MKKLYSTLLIGLFILLGTGGTSYAQEVDFNISDLDFNGFSPISGGTSLKFGPDNRLYATERYGLIKIYTIQKVAANDYEVTAVEVIDAVQDIPNHNDDGTTNSTPSNRQVTGITVAGTAANPVMFVSSSDPRVGAGGSGSDKGLDTNSGVVTMLSWNGSAWDVVDLVRGLPRSEENHATNGLEYTVVGGNEYLIVASGGFTNAGAPSNNFAFITEYALAAAILVFDLTELKALPTLNDGVRDYKYDLPTLDDPTRANVNGIEDPDDPGYNGEDVGDPWGGNDGLNQAMLIPNSPVQILSPGYRNSYDIVLTESGALYVTDNGANGGWGGLPENEGVDGTVTNNYYDPNEPGSTSGNKQDGEWVDNEDHLHKITDDISSYITNSLGSYYGGHPTPVRANPTGAGLYTYDNGVGVFRTLLYDPSGGAGKTTNKNIALPANWPPVKTGANPVEGDFRTPSRSNPEGPNDSNLTVWPNNANGIDEYTASNFGGAMQGDLVVGRNNDADLYRVQLNPDGTVEDVDTGFALNMGGNALGITCNSDTDIFPGTIWVATFNGSIRILEPNDQIENCVDVGDPGYSADGDSDLDGYLNQDEVDNGTLVCSTASKPSDFDAAAGGNPLVSDLNDSDDDNDGIPDASDPLQLGDPLDGGTDAFSLPVYNTLLSDNPVLKGYLGLGFTGFMNNGDTGANWFAWTDREDDPNDPNPNDILGGAIGAMTMQMTAGTAVGSANNQEKAMQYGVVIDNNDGIVTVEAGMQSFDQIYQILHSGTPSDAEVGVFIGDGSQSNFIQFVLKKTGLEAMQEIGDAQDAVLTENLSGSELPTGQGAFIKLYFVIDTSTGVVEFRYSINGGEIQSIGTITAKGSVLSAIQNGSNILTVGLIGTSNQAGAEVEGTWTELNVINGEPVNTDSFSVPLVRINAGGALVPDAVLDWAANTGVDATSGTGYTVSAGKIYNPGNFPSRGSSIPDYISSSQFEQLFDQERYDQPEVPDMTFDIPLANGTYLIRLYFANGFNGTSDPGQRVFVVAAEGVTLEQSLDLSARFGHQVGVALSYPVTVGDGVLNVSLLHGAIENPLINAIEVLGEDQLTTDPIVVSAIADQQLTEGVPLDGSLVVQYTGGDGSTVAFGGQGLPLGVEIDPVTGVISGTPALGESAGSPFNATVTVSDDSGTAQVSFAITVLENTAVSEYTVPLVRINAGGAQVADPDNKLDWEDNATPGSQIGGSYSVNVGNISNTSGMQRHPSIPDYISVEEFNALFAQERWDPAAEPPMQFDIPIENGTYLLRMYMGNNFGGSSEIGERVFSFSAEGVVLGTAIDLVALFGHKQGGVLSYVVTVEDDVLNILFEHGAANNPLVDAIELLGIGDGQSDPIVVEAIADQTFTEEVFASVQVNYTGGDGSPVLFEASGLPAGIDIDPQSGEISGVADSGQAADGPFSVSVTVSDDSFSASTSFQIMVEEAPALAPGTPVVRINAGGAEVADPVLNWEANTGDGAVTGVSYFVNTGKVFNVINSPNADLPARAASIPDYVTEQQFSALFGLERYDQPPAQDPEEMQFDIPLPNGVYTLRLYMANAFNGASDPGDRVFDILAEEQLIEDDLDLVGRFGHQEGVALSYEVNVTDGELNVLFQRAVENPLVNAIEVIAGGLPTVLTIADITDKVFVEGLAITDIDVTVNGGDGSAVQFGAVNLPQGLNIDPATGVISGMPAVGSAQGSPYEVTVNADDDTGSDSETFFIQVVEPLLLDPIAEQTFTEGVQLDGSLVVGYTGGDGSNLSFEAEGLPSGLEIEPTIGVIGGTPAPGTAANSPYTVTVTVSDNTFVETVSFDIVVEPGAVPDGTPVVRINAGSDVTDPNGVLDWEGNNQQGEQIGDSYTVNTGQNVTVQGAIVRTALIPDYITQEEFEALFAQERYDQPAEPKMQFDIPLPDGTYTVNLYLADTYSQTTQPGDRLFNIYAEGQVLEQSLDLVDRFGDDQAVALTYEVIVSDGVLEIMFEHAGANNPIISAIEVLTGAPPAQPLVLNPISDQVVTEGVALAAGLQATISGGDGSPVSFVATGLPTGVTINETTGVIGGIPAQGSANITPYQVQVSASDASSQVNTTFFMTVESPPVSGAVWTEIDEDLNYTGRHENSAVQAGDKFFLLGGRENPDIIDIWDFTTNTWENVPSNVSEEFNHYQAVEYGGYIWVIGAFKDNDFPNELPTEFVWMLDPVNLVWIQGPEIPVNRRRGSAGLVVHEGKFYVIGGNTIGHNGGYVAWFDMFDPATGEWTVLGDAPRARDHFHAAVVDGKIYVAGGRLSGGPGGTFNPLVAEVDVYDFDNQQWSTLPVDSNIPTPRAASVTVNFNEELYIAGGEVSGQTVYGVPNVTDALPVTEIFNPQTGWRRGPDMNHERHGTQGIVSGGGIFVFSGSPKIGGGNQQNMEALYSDTPAGSPSVASALSLPSEIEMETGETVTINIQPQGGNVGMQIREVSLSGSPEFNLIGGPVYHNFLLVGQTLSVDVSLSQAGADQEAYLTVAYGLDQQMQVRLFNGEIQAGLINPGTQFNNEGDVVSLPIVFTPPSPGLNFQASNLPPTLTMDPNTGLISGTILEATDGSGSGNVFQPNPDGSYVIQAEDGNPTGFGQTTSGGAIGIIGNSNHFGSPTAGGEANYSINVTEPGVYRVIWRSFHSGPIGSEENDSWLKFDNNANVWFFGIKGNTGSEQNIIDNVTGTDPASANIVFPKGSGREGVGTTPEGSGANGFFKIYKSSGGSETYIWQAFTSDNDPHNVYVYFVNPGEYSFTIAERSAGHAIDKIALYPVGQSPNLDNLPESNTGGSDGTPGALANSPYNVVVSVTDPNNPANNDQIDFQWVIGDGSPQEPIANISLSDTNIDLRQSISFSGSGSIDPDGTISSYNWNLGDGGTSTQASFNYTYALPGIYTVTLTVTDNDGNTDQEQVTVSVVDPDQPSNVFVLDARDDSTLFNLKDGLEINKQQTGDIPFGIVYRTTPSKVVSFVLNGPINQTISEGPLEPVSLFGDIGVDVNGQIFPVGEYTLSVTPQGEDTQVYNFTVVEGPVITYDILASAGTGGSIDPEGTVTVNEGESQFFVITPDIGFAISDVLVDGQSVEAVETYTFENVGKDGTIEAVFSPIPTYTITPIAGTGGMITPSETVTVNEGDDQVFSFDADPGYEIADVLVNNQSVGNPADYTFTNVTEDATIEVVFSEVPTFTITVTVGSGGIVSPSESVEVNQGANQTFSITPNPGKVIDEILVNGELVANANSYTFFDVNENGSIAVTFTDAPAPTIGVTGFALYNADTDQFLMNIAEGMQIPLADIQGDNLAIVALTGGTVGSVVLNLSGEKVQTQTESFAPYALFGDSAGDYEGELFGLGDYTIAGTAFSSSGGGGNVVGTPLSVTFQIVEVQLPSFVITVNAGTGGTIDPSSAVTVLQGDSQTFVIEADTGFEIADVLVDGLSVGAVSVYVFEDVTANATIEAIFSEVPTFTITASAGLGGSISPDNEVPVSQGGSQTFSISPEAGFEIADVLVDDVSVGAVSVYVFEDVTADATIEAIFSEVPTFTITASAGPGGSITPGGEVPVSQGADQTFIITPNPGKVIDQILVNGSPVSGQGGGYTFSNVNADASIAVSFADAPVAPSNVFVLNANDDTVLYNMFDGLVISKQQIGNIPLGMIYESNPSVVVNWQLSGPINRTYTEGPSTPVSLFGDIGTNVLGQIFPEGNYTLAVTAAGQTEVYNFSVVDAPPVFYTISASAGNGGSISPPGQVEVVGGTNLTFTFTPDSGFAVSDVVVGGQSVGNPGSYTFTNVSEDSSISVSFEAVPTYTITASAGPGGRITPGGEVPVSQGADQTFTISPDNGKEIDQLLVNGQPISPQFSYTFNDVGTDGSISVTFKDSEFTGPIAGFNYIDASDDSIVTSINQGTSINGALYGGDGFNIEVITNPAVAIGSVLIKLSGAASNNRVESVAPFAAYGDTAGDFWPANFPAGQYTVEAIAYSGAGGSGSVLGVLAVNFEITSLTPTLQARLVGNNYAYPNPAKGEVNLALTEPAKWQFAEIYTLAGARVRTFDLTDLNPSGRETVTLPIYGLQPGIYSVQLVGRNGEYDKIRVSVME